MYKKILSALIVAACIVSGVAPLAHATVDPNMNKPEYWATILQGKNYTAVNCTKIDETAVSYTADQNYALVVLKAGTVSETWYDVKAGATVQPSSGKDISHVIMCTGIAPPSATNRFVQLVICGAPDDVYLPDNLLTLGAQYVSSTNLEFSFAYTFGFTMIDPSQPASVTYTYPDANGQLQTATETFVDDNTACLTTM